MSNNHLTYFKVENFKKFDSLEVKNIGQFNLIVGDNNVGKTCLLEALLVDDKGLEYTNSNFLASLINRGILTPRTFIYSNFSFSNFLPKNDGKVRFTLNKLEVNISYDDKGTDFTDIKESIKELDKTFKYEIDYTFLKDIFKDFNYPLVSFVNKDFDIIELYNKLSTKKEKEDLIKALKVIFPLLQDIEHKVEFKQIHNTFIFTFEDKEEFIPLNYLGDGFRRIFYIVLKALSLKGKRIMIDEIEIGIHHSRQKDFFINLFKICKELDVQLFATTHSNECIKAFVEASIEVENEKEVRVIKLEESTDKTKIYSSTFYFENIQAGFESNVDLRG